MHQLHSDAMVCNADVEGGGGKAAVVGGALERVCSAGSAGRSCVRSLRVLKYVC